MPSDRSATLTPRERAVLRLMVLHFDDQEIASRLGISVHTVYKHVRSICRKLGVSTRSQAARAGIALLRD
jgi:DNA-binding CsgD family transcriptional regulator